MHELGLATPFWILVLIWLAKVILLVLVSALLALFAIVALDILTPLHERRSLGDSPVSVGLFIAGFFVMIGLVIHGAVTALTTVTAPVLTYIFDFRTWGLLAISFVVSLLIGIALFFIVDRLTPTIPFLSIKESPVAVGVYIFGYLIFFGLILNAALTGPL